MTSRSEKAFYDCKKLTTVRPPTNLVTIRRKAFYGCSSLVSIDLPAGLATIEDDAFFLCQSVDAPMRARVRAVNRCAALSW